MQLSAARGLLAALSCWLLAASVCADADVSLGSSVFRESGGPLRMNVIMPSARASVDLGEPVTLRVGYSADIVSGASVAVVDAPAANVDAISTATVSDTRHVFNGTVTLRDAAAGSVDVGFTHAFEHDYRSNALAVTAKSDLFDRNTSIEISYARAFDRVCDMAGDFEPVLKPRLDTSAGCFSDDKTRRTRPLAIHDLHLAVSQVFTPVFTGQLSVLAQVLHGFQGNPYRAVRIGKTAAQEFEPNDRARYALGAALRYWLVPLSAALGGELRGYRDTWGITSLSAELGYDQRVLPELRVRVRARYYTQTEAEFYSDDYVLAPRGRYFTGDRELSSMRSALFGLAVRYSAPSAPSGRVLGVFARFDLTLKGDLFKTFFDDFHYDRAEVPNTLAQILTLELMAGF